MEKEGMNKTVVLKSILWLCLGIIFILPVFLIIMNAFKPNNDILTSFISFPKSLYLENFSEAMRIMNFWTVFRNTLFVTVCTVIVASAVSFMSAYGISHLPQKTGDKLYTLFVVGQTPQGWNGGVFSMIQNLSETVVIPIAGMILTFVLVYELIQMILEKNNMHEFDTFNIFKWIFKTFVATYLLTNCFTIVMAVFDVAQNVVSQSAGVINGNLDVQAALSDLKTQLEAMGMWELIGLWLETNIINLCMWVLSIVIFVIVYGRMIEIYLTVSLAPIPFSTMANREWGQMGTGYLRSLFALGFQGFLILICVAIYAVLVQSIPSSGDVHGAIWGTAGYTVLLAFALFKTGSLSKSIFNAR